MAAKHRFFKYVSLLMIIIPVFLLFGNIAGMMLLGSVYNWRVFVPVSLGIILVCLIIKKPLDKCYLKYKELSEFDEFGVRKKKSRYSYSKEQQDMMDLQRMADMERILSKGTINKITKRGSEDPVKDTNDLIGLLPVKTKMKEMVARMKFESQNPSKKGSGNSFGTRHMVFFGPPGTGKTTVARILTGFLYKYKYIKENKCVEVDGNFLKAGTPADTATKVKYLIRVSYGGVLFIDEAYALMGDACGLEAIATLIKEMEDHRDAFILIMAGYTKEMKDLLDANPGFHSRIKEYLNFPDYTDRELCDIFRYMAAGQNFAIDGDAYDVFVTRMQKERKTASFGNARTVRNVLEESIDRHALNLMEKKIPESDRYKLVKMDISPSVDIHRI